MYVNIYVRHSECIELIYVLQSLHPVPVPRTGYDDLTRYRCKLATFIHSSIRVLSLAQPPAPLRSAHSGGGGAEEPYLLR